MKRGTSTQMLSDEAILSSAVNFVVVSIFMLFGIKSDVSEVKADISTLKADVSTLN